MVVFLLTTSLRSELIILPISVIENDWCEFVRAGGSVGGGMGVGLWWDGRWGGWDLDSSFVDVVGSLD